MDREDFIALVSIIGGVILFTLLLVGFANIMSERSCAATADLMGLEYHYSLTTPCMVKTDGRWEPLNWQRSVRIKETN